MKKYVLYILLSITVILNAQSNKELLVEIEAYHQSENEKFSNQETTILTQSDFEEFKELDFYKPNLNYRVEATFVRTPNEKPFLMPTSTNRTPEYVKYGEAHFKIKRKSFVLNLYQNTTPYDDPELSDYLFLPFTDLTSGTGSYGGGRFLDARIPDGASMVLDFNKAYNPYCAYNPNYSCPIPPAENDLAIKIKAGVKAFH